jgi:hypothetical protein
MTVRPIMSGPGSDDGRVAQGPYASGLAGDDRSGLIPIGEETDIRVCVVSSSAGYPSHRSRPNARRPCPTYRIRNSLISRSIAFIQCLILCRTDRGFLLLIGKAGFILPGRPQKAGRQMKAIVSVLGCLLASGCAWQSAALKVGEDAYQVSANASPARGGVTGAREMALTNANAKCDSLGQKINVTNIQTESAFPANRVETVTFTCQ